MSNDYVKKISLKCTSHRDAEAKAKELLAPLQTADITEKTALHVAHAQKLVKSRQNSDKCSMGIFYW